MRLRERIFNARASAASLCYIREDLRFEGIRLSNWKPVQKKSADTKSMVNQHVRSEA